MEIGLLTCDEDKKKKSTKLYEKNQLQERRFLLATNLTSGCLCWISDSDFRIPPVWTMDLRFLNQSASMMLQLSVTFDN